MKYLAAPCVREEADVPVIGGMCQIIENNELVEVPNYRFKFLSNYCAKLISEKVQNDLRCIKVICKISSLTTYLLKVL